MKDIETLAAVVAAGPEWHTRTDRTPIPPEWWGKDHGQAFVEVLYAVRHNSGLMDWARLMLSARNWPMLYAAKGKLRGDSSGEDAADKFGLRLGQASEGIRLYGHCQGDVLADFADHGLITITMPPVSEDGEHYLKPNGHPLRAGDRIERAGRLPSTGQGDWPVPADLPTGHVEWDLMPWARFAMTDRGWKVAHELDLRTSQGSGLTWNGFFTEMLGAGAGRPPLPVAV